MSLVNFNGRFANRRPADTVYFETSRSFLRGRQRKLGRRAAISVCHRAATAEQLRPKVAGATSRSGALAPQPERFSARVVLRR